MTFKKFSCRECGRPANPDFTMRFDDLGEEPLLWCTTCGPFAKRMAKALTQAFETEAGFAEKLEAELEKRTN